ncbi:hypothetical protein JXO59_04840 [candidate division KSB1 bacterium]|nr:hypothetical protein [candidate division KSB1 bacterium]
MIKIIDKRLSREELTVLCAEYFKTMVKFVVDVEKELMAVGGELQADAETLLLQQGSSQHELWGGNFYPWNEPEKRIEYTSFINIRPSDDNADMEVLNGAIKDKIRMMCERLLMPANEIMPEQD